MLKGLLNQIPINSKIALWGLGYCGKAVKNAIELERKDVEIVYVIDSFIDVDASDKPLIRPTDIMTKKSEFDLIVFTTTKSLSDNISLLEFLNVDCIYATYELEQYCRLMVNYSKLGIDNFIDMFDEESTSLYKSVLEHRWQISDKLLEQACQKYELRHTEPSRNYKYQYLEFINRDAIKTIIDGGVYNGAHLFCFKKYFKNLNKIYAFEPLYDEFKNDYLDYYLKDFPELEIIKLGLWDTDTELSFRNSFTSSRIIDPQKVRRNDKITTISTTSIDEFKRKNKVDKIDFIKLDIEGAELNCLRAAVNTIYSDRPQMAISIYHGDSDLYEIPRFIKSLLYDKNYKFHLGHYSPVRCETVLYAVPAELEL